MILANAAASFAATKTYVAVGSSNFSTAAAWSPAGAPASADSIVLGNAITADSTITIDSGGVVAATTLDTTRTYTITLAPGGPTVFNAGALNLTAGTLAMAPGGANTLRASSLTIASSGATLDLNDHSAVFDINASSFEFEATLRNALLAGRITGDDTFRERIGYADVRTVFKGASSGTFAGQSVTSENAVLLRRTLAGDADLDGIVRFDDLVRLAKNYSFPGAAGTQLWSRGDFNYDGSVNFDDLVAMAQNYNKTYTPSADVLMSLSGESFAADWQRATALVPEPATLAALASAVPLALHRRRRRAH